MNQQIISVKDLRLNLTKYLNLLLEGQSFIIVKRSLPVAKITPFESDQKKTPQTKIDQILSFAGSFSDINEKEWIKNIHKNRKIITRKIPQF